ncbi:MAG: PaaX family transcriptional regulator C-terminal domain-containing protein [Actinomycetota bacterium]|nr:PaaX family transcriptional regulator C-terminal domain-containing protein [Actinomycetota bacterium]
MPDDDPIAQVLAVERPLSARGVLVTCLLGSRRSSIPGRDLVAAARLFGVAEGTVRTALSRMVSSGEVLNEDGRYELAPGSTRNLRSEHTDAGTVRCDWDGSWELHVVRSGRRSAEERTTLRSAAARLRLAELREGVWTRPRNLTRPAFDAEQAVVVDQCEELVGSPTRDPGELAARLWDLERWAERADHLVRSVDPALDELSARGREALATVFRLQVAIRRHVGEDPLLPDELLPASWPGEPLRARYDELHRAFREVIVPIIRSVR